MPFISLSTYSRTALLLMLLVLQITAIAAFINSWSIERKKRSLLSVLLLAIIYLFILIMLSAVLYEKNAGHALHPTLMFFANLPAVVYLMLFTLGAVIFALMMIKDHRRRKGIITRLAFKEAADNLPTGLCFGTESGIVILVNRTMERLCHTLTGHDLQDVSAFWERVSSGELCAGAKRLTDTESPILQLADGASWCFSHRLVEVEKKQVVQLIATDTTDLDKLRHRLTQANEELDKMNARLIHHGENIAEVTAKEERLATKIRLHNEFGHILLYTRRILANEADEKEVRNILGLWGRNIRVLRAELEPKEITMLEHLQTAAADVGITLKVDGTIPKDNKDSRLFIFTAGSEALNNAVRHAEATELYISISETKGHYTAAFSNNGKVPESEITEGGGLSSLRAKIEGQGGQLHIQSLPFYQMTITLPKRKGVKDD